MCCSPENCHGLSTEVFCQLRRPLSYTNTGFFFNATGHISFAPSHGFQKGAQNTYITQSIIQSRHLIVKQSCVFIPVDNGKGVFRTDKLPRFIANFHWHKTAAIQVLQVVGPRFTQFYFGDQCLNTTNCTGTLRTQNFHLFHVHFYSRSLHAENIGKEGLQSRESLLKSSHISYAG